MLLKNKMTETQGTLTYLEHIYKNGIFQKSELHIQEENCNIMRDFYAYVPESVLGKKVFLFQDGTEEAKGLFQRLLIEEKEGIFQIRATH
jgi:hypothetical protein